MTAGPFTVVSFHAHPDDEALLTGGTLATAAAAGHRVVLVTATSGDQGLAAESDGRGAALARVRAAELARAAEALGCSRVVTLGHRDSGLYAEEAGGFATLDVERTAAELAALLVDEAADVLTIYDRNGGYGHPDHVQVHRVGSRAAQLAGTTVVLEATAPAGAFRALLRVLGPVGRRLGIAAPVEAGRVFSTRAEITHRVDVRSQLDAKRAAMAAHESQQRGEGGPRALTQFLRLPRTVFSLVFGREWFIEQGRAPARPVETDIFASLR